MVHRSTRTRIFLSLLVALLLTSFPAKVEATTGVDLPPLEEFVESLQNGEADELRGIYVPDVLASAIVPQPEGDEGFVSTSENTLTQFGLASQYGSTGLLAHNYLAGRFFSLIKTGQMYYLVYGDGRTETFIVTDILRYQALDPDNLHSPFRDLETGRLFSATKLFLKVYAQPGHVILQTCINANGNPSWGRLFVVAEPYEGVIDPVLEPISQD